MRRVSFPFRFFSVFVPAPLLLYKAQNLPAYEWCSHVWDGASSASLPLLDQVQHKAMWLINKPPLTFNLQSLAYRRSVSSLSFSYRYYFCSCSSKACFFSCYTSAFHPLIPSSCPPYQISVRQCRTSLIFSQNCEAFEHAHFTYFPTHLQSICLSFETDSTSRFLRKFSP